MKKKVKQTLEVLSIKLPEDILVEIFARLPAKSVGKCRCLSKFWSTRLSTTQFIQKHLITRRRALHKRPNIIFCRKSFVRPAGPLMFDFSLITITSPTKVEVVSRKVDVGYGLITFFGSCNGIVLLSTRLLTTSNNPIKLLLINPITLNQLYIPASCPEAQLISTDNKFKMCDIFGLGYDRVSDDYKIVSVSIYIHPTRFYSSDTVLQVYSVKSGAWKVVHDMCGLEFCYRELVPGGAFNASVTSVFVNEAMHWFSSTKNHRSIIAAFDLASESLCAISFPTIFDNRDVKDIPTEIYVLDGCLCVVEKLSDGGVFDLMIMKEYGVADSWCSFRIRVNHLPESLMRFNKCRSCGVLCFVGDEKVLGVTMNDRWYVFNLKEGTVKEVAGLGGIAGRSVVCFIDSLISPEQLAPMAETSLSE